MGWKTSKLYLSGAGRIHSDDGKGTQWPWAKDSEPDRTAPAKTLSLAHVIRRLVLDIGCVSLNHAK